MTVQKKKVVAVQKRPASSPTGTAESHFLHLPPWELRTEIFDLWIHLALEANGTRWATQHSWWLLLVQMQQWTFNNHIKCCYKNRGSSAPKPKGAPSIRSPNWNAGSSRSRPDPGFSVCVTHTGTPQRVDPCHTSAWRSFDVQVHFGRAWVV